MSLYEQIIAVYPELTITSDKDEFYNGTIVLADDGDGINYIKEWNYSKPIPDGLKLGK
jgi:hypothetical protein